MLIFDVDSVSHIPLRQLIFECKGKPLKIKRLNEWVSLLYFLKHFKKIIVAGIWRMKSEDGGANLEAKRPLRRLLE